MAAETCTGTAITPPLSRWRSERWTFVDVAAQAKAAWEAAVCWDPTGTDQLAAKRLAEVRAV
jgi:hypothetical protein